MKKTAIALFLFGLSSAAYAGGTHEVPVVSDTVIDVSRPADNFGSEGSIFVSVSYTHLDVYKRQQAAQDAATERWTDALKVGVTIRTEVKTFASTRASEKASRYT